MILCQYIRNLKYIRITQNGLNNIILRNFTLFLYFIIFKIKIRKNLKVLSLESRLCLKHKYLIKSSNAIDDVVLEIWYSSSSCSSSKTAWRDNSQGCSSKRSSQLIMVVFDFKGVHGLSCDYVVWQFVSYSIDEEVVSLLTRCHDLTP
ncbi:hypothetical protein BpHYR1_040182 [Brachionus plicatilis]|uniref:Uncharacterized protein n=1 Tax=Brachionus plicatilis TaxID=10195 RepID=A0A3M7QI45_BRAPC|nr:hypothetical protein BpHYR1_040182 [Brachionus plicatilis]